MRLKLLILGLVSILFFSMIATASEPRDYKLSVENVEYELVKTEGTSAQQTFEFYKITFSLHNDGPDDSDDLEVYIQESKEEDGFRTYRYGTVPAGETETFIFGDVDYDGTQWIVQGAAPHKVYVNYYPALSITDPLNYTKTSFNSGNYTFNIGDTASNNDSIPGFEILIVIGALITITFIKRKKKKYEDK